jgi:hypothetical protein
MLGGNDTAIRGIIDGLKCLKNLVKLRGHDPNTTSLLELVCQEANSIVKVAISRGAINERVLWIAQQCNAVLEDMVGVSGKAPMWDQIRCQSLFNLAEIHRQRRRYRICIQLLQQCEVIMDVMDDNDGDPPLEYKPSLYLIRTCLSEMFFLTNDPMGAIEKS